MGEMINLKRFKKRSQREQSAKAAEASRARFGRSKAKRQADERRAQRASELLDQHRIDDGNQS
jgi:hypothetical protein